MADVNGKTLNGMQKYEKHNYGAVLCKVDPKLREHTPHSYIEREPGNMIHAIVG